MAQNDLISVIDQAIAALQQARTSLRSTDSTPTKAPTENAPLAKRHMSEAGRIAIAEAQRKRWAAKKKAAKKAARLSK